MRKFLLFALLLTCPLTKSMDARLARAVGSIAVSTAWLAGGVCAKYVGKKIAQAAFFSGDSYANGSLILLANAIPSAILLRARPSLATLMMVNFGASFFASISTTGLASAGRSLSRVDPLDISEVFPAIGSIVAAGFCTLPVTFVSTCTQDFRRPI